MTGTPIKTLAAAFLVGTLAGQNAVLASDSTAAPGRIHVELNNTETVESDCRVTFMVSNRTEFDLAKLSLELVLIGGDGKVADFLRVGILPVDAGRSRAQRFDVGNLTCEALGRILLNEAAACEAAGSSEAGEAEASAACAELLDPSSRTGIAFDTKVFAD